MKLVVVESPAKAKTINKYLGSDYLVLASYGHICDLPSKNGSVVPENDFEMKYEISSKSLSHVKKLVDQAKKSDEILLATDPDREGEAISWHVIRVLKEKNAIKKDTKIKRVAFNEITKKAVKNAIESARDIDDNLVDSQQARRALDYLVGFNVSPVLWRKLPGSKSAGRVQSVALRLICEREEEIEKFITREYWDLWADYIGDAKKTFSAKLSHFDGKKLEKLSLENSKQANDIREGALKEKYEVKNLDTKLQRRSPSAPFTTSTIQQEASRKLGFSTKKTMQVAQKLYEGIDIENETIGLITYMRTDGVYIAEDAVNQIRDYIKSEIGNDYLPDSVRSYKSKDKNAQEAHEAIRPTNIKYTPQKLGKFLSNDEIKLYELIWKRTIASQMENAQIETAIAEIYSDSGKYIFRAIGSIVKFDGFYRIYKEDIDDKEASHEDNDKILPPLKLGERLTLEKIDANQHFTEAPPRYTEASLVKKLEELGIGRPSTYSSIISVIQDRSYVKLEKKRFIPESRGRIVTSFLKDFFAKYVEYDFTAELENHLDLIAEGKMKWKELLQNFWEGFYNNVKNVSNIKNSEILDNINEKLSGYFFPVTEQNKDPRKCPSCNDGILGLRMGKFGAFIACSNYPECEYKRSVGDNKDDAASEGNEDVIKPIDNSKLLGRDKGGNEIWLKKGPYGFYVQVGESSKENPKPKRSSIPPKITPETVSLDYAITLLSLPIALGNNPGTGNEMQIGIGKFGPFIKHGKKFTSIPKGEDPFSITFDRAIEIIRQYEKN